MDCALLIFPPTFYPHMPYLSMPLLAGNLNTSGVRHFVVDLNVELFDHFLKEHQVKDAWRQLRRIRRKNGLSPKQASKLELTGHESMAGVASLVQLAKNAVRGVNGEFDSTLDPWRILTLGLDIISDVHFPEELTFSEYKLGIKPDSCDNISNYLSERHRSIYYKYSTERLTEVITSEPIRIVGLSITAPDQIMPAAGLSAFLREAFPQVRIVWGGSIVTRLKSVFAKKNPLSWLYDAVVLGEGDNIASRAFNTVLAGRHGSEVGQPQVFEAEERSSRIENLPVPDFSQLPLELYFDKVLTLPLLASKHCYWGKCLFCDIPRSYFPKHRARTPDRVVNDMQVLSSTYDTNRIKFVDDAISPRLLRGIVTELITQGINLEWEAFVRIEREFAEDSFCRELHKAGCRWLYFGLESSNEETLRKMNKGVTPDLAEKVIRTVSRAGINVHLWVITGFPTDTKDDTKKTLDFLHRNKQFIDSVEVNQFALSRLAPLMNSEAMKQFGITLKTNEDRDLALLYDYTISGGLSQKEAGETVVEVRNFLRKDLGILDTVRSSNLSRT